MSTYLVYDLETTYGKTFGRVGNRWDSDFGLCSIGWKYGNGEYGAKYTVKWDEEKKLRLGLNPMSSVLPLPDLTNVTLLVGHNIKFDLLWYWDHPDMKAFIKRGGKIWDTMYAEYLVSGQLYSQNQLNPAYQINLKACGNRRALNMVKTDLVKALWDAGARTEDIKETILMEYMRSDILSTEELFQLQVQQARKQGQIRMIQNSMDGLLGTTEMEFNGMKIDYDLAMVQKADLEETLSVLWNELQEFLPEFPEGCEFKWTSWRHLSALFFGGDIPYQGREYILDENNNLTYYMKKEFKPDVDSEGVPKVYKSGKRVGQIKGRMHDVPDIERGPKMRNCTLVHTLPRLTKPSSRWAAESGGENPDGTPRYYSTSADNIEKLKGRGISIIESLLKYRKHDKDLGTYYIREGKGGIQTGLLTNVQPSDGCVHGSLNHAVTVTRRLSADSPNLQNLNKKGAIKKTFVSRWALGVVSELDYSQLEVVAQGVNSGDSNLLKALVDGVCFHCEWASFVIGEPYEKVYRLAKVEEDPVYVAHRQAAKPIGFGENYGAGVPTLSENSGVPADLIEAAIAARKLKYPRLYAFHENVSNSVEQSATNTRLRTENGFTRQVGYYVSQTTTIYSFLQNEALPWQQKRGILTAFSPTTIKNYPSQGLGGEIMQTMLGLVFRMLVRFDLTDRIKLILTVHDSLYVDFMTEELAKEYMPKIAAVLEDVCWYFNACFERVNWNTPFPVDGGYGRNIKEANNKVSERDLEWVRIIRSEFK